MQKLDLSLDIPGAPFVRNMPVEGEQGDSGDGERPHPASSVFGFSMQRAATALAVETLPLPTSVAADDLEVREKVIEAFKQFGRTEMSVVPADATVRGHLTCKSIRIQGELTGSVCASGLVVVEEGAVLNGQVVQAEIVVMFGTVAATVNQAAIRCKGLVVLAESARVIGHVQCGAVAIYQGARLVGTVQACPA
ncbi:MAG: polymer-forming cytoskeletal protein [Pseudomonadota bacterium]